MEGNDSAYSRFPRYARGTSDSESSGTGHLWRHTKSRRHPGNRTIEARGYLCFALTVLIVCSVSFVLGRFIWNLRSSANGGGDAVQILHKPSFLQFSGADDCGIMLESLYKPPTEPNNPPFCRTSENLLEALSGGGRHGFDEPFFPKGCHYRWFTTEETCMVLERFDGIVFIGDQMIQHIYAAFNALLREDLALGGLAQWRMNEGQRATCKCDQQFLKHICTEYTVLKSEEVVKHNGDGVWSPHKCHQKIPHVFIPHLIPIIGNPTPPDRNAFQAMLKANPNSFRPIPIIHSIGLGSSFSQPTATYMMDQWISMADESGRNTPFLWIGPNAAGYMKHSDHVLREGSNVAWVYSMEMGVEARRRGSDVLNMWNLTVQASSQDGSLYGERVALVQAMMVINWLSRLRV